MTNGKTGRQTDKQTEYGKGTCHNFTSANPKHTLLSDVILRRTTFSQPILPLAPPVMRPDSLPRLWHDTNALLTYLLTYRRMDRQTNR